MPAVFGRELAAYFQNLTGFIFMGFFLLISGIFFTLDNLIPQSPDYVRVLGSITFIFLIVVPVLTMRLFSEESRQKTDQLLLTSPLRITAIVVGKYLAAQAVFLVTLVITLIYPLQLALVGTVDVAKIMGSYVGFFLLGSAFISVGLFVSSLTDSQVVAAVVTFGLLLLMWIIDFVQQGLPVDRASGLVFAIVLSVGALLFVYFTIRNLLVSLVLAILEAGTMTLLYLLDPSIFEGLIVRFLKWFSLLDRYKDFTIGVLKLSPVVYYISFCFVFIFLTIRVVEARRWK